MHLSRHQLLSFPPFALSGKVMAALCGMMVMPLSWKFNDCG